MDNKKAAIYFLKKDWPIVSACHAGMPGDHRTPVGSAAQIVQFTIDSELHYFYQSRLH
jgi:hypothetical protein